MNGYSRKHRKTRRTRRGTRRKGYGETTSKHTEWGIDAARKASSSATDAAMLAQEHRCNDANNHLKLARGFMGHAVAHSKSGGLVTLGPVSSDLERATRVFNHYCKIVKR